LCGRAAAAALRHRKRHLRFLYTGPAILNSTYTPPKIDWLHPIEQEVNHGCGVCVDGLGPVAGPVADGLGAGQACKTSGRTAMNLLHVLYGAGGLCALLLLVYLVYALFCAEEF
jgi:K+-transporting ATPase ATPase F chain